MFPTPTPPDVPLASLSPNSATPLSLSLFPPHALRLLVSPSCPSIVLYFFRVLRYKTATRPDTDATNNENPHDPSSTEPTDVDQIYQVLKQAGEISSGKIVVDPSKGPGPIGSVAAAAAAAAAAAGHNQTVSNPPLDIPVVKVPEYPDRAPWRGPVKSQGPNYPHQKQGLTAPVATDMSCSGPPVVPFPSGTFLFVFTISFFLLSLLFLTTCSVWPISVVFVYRFCFFLSFNVTAPCPVQFVFDATSLNLLLKRAVSTFFPLSQLYCLHQFLLRSFSLSFSLTVSLSLYSRNIYA